jgi:hypothetical protein
VKLIFIQFTRLKPPAASERVSRMLNQFYSNFCSFDLSQWKYLLTWLSFRVNEGEESPGSVHPETRQCHSESRPCGTKNLPQSAELRDSSSFHSSE